MNKTDKVLKACIGLTRRDIVDLNVFDLMYETSLIYPELKGILDELVSQNELAVIDIKTYKFIGDVNREFEEDEPKIPDFQTVFDSLDDDALDARQVYLEKRRQELIKKMTDEAEEDYDEDDDDDEDDEDDLFGELTKIDKSVEEDYGFRYKALKHCIVKGQVSVAMLQRDFPIGYIGSCKLVDWMESMGYISAAEGSKPRKILITLEEFNKMFDEPQ